MIEDKRLPMDADTGGRRWTDKIDLPQIPKLETLRKESIERDQEFQKELFDATILSTIRDTLSSSK